MQLFAFQWLCEIGWFWISVLRCSTELRCGESGGSPKKKRTKKKIPFHLDRNNLFLENVPWNYDMNKYSQLKKFIRRWLHLIGSSVPESCGMLMLISYHRPGYAPQKAFPLPSCLQPPLQSWALWWSFPGPGQPIAPMQHGASQSVLFYSRLPFSVFLPPPFVVSRLRWRPVNYDELCFRLWPCCCTVCTIHDLLHEPPLSMSCFNQLSCC